MNAVVPTSARPSDPSTTTFLRWTGLFTITGAAILAVQLALIALATGLSLRRFGVIYLLLVWAAYDTGALFYWARFWPVRRFSVAFRFALAMFGSLTLFLGLIIFGTYDLGLISKASALFEYGPYVIPVALLTGVMSFFAWRHLNAR